MKATFTSMAAAALCMCAALMMTSCKGGSKTAVEEENIPANVCKFTSEGFNTYWISESAEPRMNQASLFKGVTEEIINETGIANGIPSSMSTFLIKADGKNLLFDTGLGTPNSLLLPSLDSLGVKPENVDAIFITHLHGDHVGGLAKDGVAVFPNAKVYISKTEYETMGGEETLAPYKDNVVCFEFGDKLICDIETINAAGHTPGHACYLKGDVLIAGDIMHGVALQIVHPEFNASYDRDPETASETRVKMIELAKENKLLLGGMHFPAPGVIDYRN